MMNSSVNNITVFGNGLAGLLCVAKLKKVLPKSVELTYVESLKPNKTDIFFGTVTSPETYDFLLALGISEPDIFLQTNTSFSLGTHYKNWGPANRHWIQSFHRPLPAYNGVAFHHYLTRLNGTNPEPSQLAPYIMSVQASEAGVFAHPPEGKKIPLADIEYGYNFLPENWVKVLTTKMRATSMKWIKADIENVSRDGDNIQSIILSNDETLEAGFVIDALGPSSKLIPPNAASLSYNRPLKAVSSFTASEPLTGVCRVLTATDDGWQSDTPLQNGTHHLAVFTSETETAASQDYDTDNHHSVDVQLGRLMKPWSGNCLALGHSAAIVEPLTPAPALLLQRDIERLVELIPIADNMSVESREYNRRFQADYDHAALFSRAFFVTPEKENSPYWQAASASDLDSKLLNKITQFESRGVPVQYDYEPFTDRDWTQLHFGMGRRPKRYDPLADHISEAQLENRLTQMRSAISSMATKMPPHHIYMAGLLKYLKEKHV